MSARTAAAAVLAAAVLAGCSAGGGGTAATAGPYVNPTVSASEPAWGQGWIPADGPLPVLRPAAAANERLAVAMAAAAPYRWTGTQARCLVEAWSHISDFDNFWDDDLYFGIAGLAGRVDRPLPPPGEPAAALRETLRTEGWWAVQPGVQIAQGLVDIEVFWGSPCGLWARAQQVMPGVYPPPVNPDDPGWRGQAGRLLFVVARGRLQLTPETYQGLCGLPGLPAADPPPACSWLRPSMTWPL